VQVPRFQRARDPDRPGGQLLFDDGEAVALVYWAHDYGEREATGWFLAMLDADGELDPEVDPRRLEVSPDIDALRTNRGLDRDGWLAQAETLEMVSAEAALRVAERVLEQR
jgi:hypothetical protein